MQTDSTHPNSNSLDVFDVPVRKYLESQIAELGYSPGELRPVIDIAVSQSKLEVSEEASKGHYLSYSRFLRARIEEKALGYIRAVLSQSGKWEAARERIKSYSSVFLTGAGISFESDVPLSRVLEDMLSFCQAKDWQQLRDDQPKCLKFKKEFGRICANKKPSVSHRLMAHNFSRHIFEIICLNWDNLIERAALELGKDVGKENEDRDVRDQRRLWKFHGDVDNIKEDNTRGIGGWLFPDEEGYVFDSFTRYVRDTSLIGQLFVFVIAGYSEKESNVYDSVISVFEAQPARPTFRVGLDLARLHEQYYVVGPSDFVLEKILPPASA